MLKWVNKWEGEREREKEQSTCEQQAFVIVFCLFLSFTLTQFEKHFSRQFSLPHSLSEWEREKSNSKRSLKGQRSFQNMSLIAFHSPLSLESFEFYLSEKRREGQKTATILQNVCSKEWGQRENGLIDLSAFTCAHSDSLSVSEIGLWSKGRTRKNAFAALIDLYPARPQRC